MILKISVLSEDYKWRVYKLYILFRIRRSLISIKIPYFMWRSNLSTEAIKEIDDLVQTLNKEI